MSLQGLMGGANPLLVLAAALLYFLFLYLRRGTGDDEHRNNDYNRSASQQAAHSESGSVRHAAASSATHTGTQTATSHSAGHSTSHSSGHSATVAAGAAAVAGAALGGVPSVRGIYEDVDYTDDTLRRHNSPYREYGSGAVAAGAAAATAAASGAHAHHHSSDRNSTAAAAPLEAAVRNTHVPEEFSYSGGGSSWKWPVIAALCASLVSCQIASKDGIAGIPGNIAALFGGGAKPIAKIEAAVPSVAQVKAKTEEVKAKATEVVETTKAKVVAAAEKAVEAAKPEPKPEPKPVPAAAPVTATGLTSYFGFAAKPDAQQTWAAPATVYVTAAAPAPAPAPAKVVAAAPAAPEPAPVSLGGVGLTSYYGIAEKPDATFPWAAPATVYKVAAPEPAPAPAAAPVSLGGVGLTSYYGIAEKRDATFPWAAAATVFKIAAPEPAPAPAAAPVSLGGVGQTSYYGIAERPDATYPWAAPATVYKVAAPAPAPKAPAPTPAAIENCRDALNAEAQAGKINFAVSSYDLLPESNRTLDKIAKLAKDCGGVLIEVGGHTDSTGKPASNKTLSEQRAKAVVNYLTGAGVPASKLKSAGYGQDRPVADNATEAGKKQNRRIEFLVTAP